MKTAPFHTKQRKVREVKTQDLASAALKGEKGRKRKRERKKGERTDCTFPLPGERKKRRVKAKHSR